MSREVLWRRKVFVEDVLAVREKSSRVFAEIAEVDQKSHSTAKILAVFNVNVGTTIDVEFTGKFHLRNIKKVASTKEMFAEGRTQFAVTGIGFCDTHEK